ncbi:flagellar biosynthetic protein FliR [Salinarimonas ramus]|uniref:Flagellar biosynthetic protein FliR n=2 Tax=Salinarimonas ramus TaxID=690164 RepID=A0A917Q8Y1_9HYPH|nr:flagellar biosynthetic protein FliR [Salinarimonas ramus]
MLAFARVGTLVMLLPGLGEQLISPRVRLAFAVLLTIVVYPAVRPLVEPQGVAGPETLTLLFGEILVGLVLGLAVRMVIGALQTAGTIIAQQMGLGFAMTVDPSMGGQQTAVGNFLTLLAITLIFVTDLHHLAIAAVRASYDMLPPGGLPESGDVARLGIEAVGRGFALAVQISAPFVVFAILFNLGLGILSRLMPQLQVFFLALPATILGGFLVLAIVVGVMMSVFLEDLRAFLALISGL